MCKFRISGLFFLFAALLSGCQQRKPQQQAYSYLIVADVEGCTDCQAKLFFHDSTAYRSINSTAHGNGHFSFRGQVPRPGFYDVYYVSQTDKTISGSVLLYLPTDSVHIRATRKAIRTTFYRQPSMGSHLRNTVVFSAAPQQQELEQYLLTRDSLWQKFFTDKALVTAKYTQTFSSGDKALTEQWADSVRNFDYRISGYWAAAADQFVQQHPSSEVSLYAMLDNRNDRPAVARFRRYYQAMPAAVRQGFYGRMLDKQLATNERRNQNAPRFVGRYVRSLAGQTPAGEKLDAEQLFKQNKLTLVEFWASWCGPCRMEMPKYRRLYTQYHRQGFGMIGVSLDTNHHQWAQAIAADSLLMPQLSELRGGNGEDIRRFGITGIPANLLVDATGKIVAVDIPFPQLQKRLQQTF